MKKELFKRILSCLLTLTLVLVVFAGCDGNGGGGDIVTNYPPVSSGNNDTDDTDDTEPGAVSGYKEVTTTETVPGTPGTDAVMGYKYELVSGDFCVIKDSEVMSTIIISADAPSAVSAAANDLAYNLELMTGQTFEVRDDKEHVDGNKILVGQSKYTDALGITFPNTYPGDEMFRVIASKNFLVLGGNDAGAYKGSQFAVTYFLESLGFGWFGIDDLWNVVPSGDTVYATECDITSTASFGSRYTRLSSAAPLLAARWFNGGELIEVDHTLGYLVPADLYNTHPEYFALSQGTRDPSGKRWWQPCLSNTDFQEHVVERVKDFFEKNPNYTMASIGQNDGNGDPNSSDYANWCECNECKAFASNFTESMIKFANIVGEKIKDEYPGRTIMFYAYFPTFEAPSSDIKIADNVTLMLCKEGGLTRFIRNGNLFNEAVGTTQFSVNFENWLKTGVENITIYEWNCPGAASDKWKNSFWIQGDVFIDNLRWFKANGVDNVFIDQGPNPAYERGDGYMDIRWPLWYVSSKASWDCNLTFEQIMLPACEKLYGAAANDMYAFYKALNDANKNCDAPNYYWALPEPDEFYTDEWVAKADAALDKALKKAEAIGGDILARVENQIDNWELTKQQI